MKSVAWLGTWCPTLLTPRRCRTQPVCWLNVWDLVVPWMCTTRHDAPPLVEDHA